MQQMTQFFHFFLWEHALVKEKKKEREVILYNTPYFNRNIYNWYINCFVTKYILASLWRNAPLAPPPDGNVLATPLIYTFLA